MSYIMQREVANTDEISISTLMVPMVPPSVQPSDTSEASEGHVTPPSYRRVVHGWRTVFVPLDQPVAFTPSLPK